MPPIGRRRKPLPIPPVERSAIETAGRIQGQPSAPTPSPQELSLRKLEFDATQNPDLTGKQRWQAKRDFDKERIIAGLEPFDWKAYYDDRKAKGFKS